mgnify:FL=1
MESGSQQEPSLEQLFAALDERIEKLKQIYVQQDGESGQRHEEILAELHETYRRRIADYETQLAAAREERRTLQRSYERLRLQKGGFGFRVILLTGVFAGMLGFLVGYAGAFIKNDARRNFDAFSRQYAMDLELHLTRHDFRTARELILTAQKLPEWEPIQPQLEMLGKTVQHAENCCNK